MEGKSSSEELQSILDAIRSSDVVESRIQQLNKLGELEVTKKSDLISLVECLTVRVKIVESFLSAEDELLDLYSVWEDYTCLDVTQCMLNKAILHVALKHLESGISSCQLQFIALGMKASIWCGKHLKMTLMSSEESQEEEHGKLFFQLLVDLLCFSSVSYSALARYPIPVDKLSMNITEKFMIEQLNLTRDSISGIKRIQSHGSEVLKVSHVVIDAVIRLCGVYAQAVNWSSSDEKFEEKNSMEAEGVNDMNHVINITKCAIEVLHEVGTIAAKMGGSLVSILNVSWKGVVTLLQIGEGVFGVKMNIADILSTLISLVIESLKCTAEAWASSLTETVSTTEARRKFLPLKFYLINAVKISALYPCQAYNVHKELMLCVRMISTFKVSMSNDNHLKTASEVFTELLDKMSFDLLNSLLNSDQVKLSLKFEILDSLFTKNSFENSTPGDDHNMLLIMDGIFSVSCQVFSGIRPVLLGQVELFLSFLRYSVDLEEDVKLGVSRKLGWLFESLVDEEVYSSVLVLQIPVLCGSGKNVELGWQPFYSSLLDALKTFMVVVSSSDAWTEVETFLLENLFHPHFLCWEIVLELWCFLVRHAEPRMVSDIINTLCSLLNLLASSESVPLPGSGMRKLARSISMLLSFGTPSLVDQAFNFITGDDISHMSSLVCLVLFMEGFPLNLLSDKMRNIATHRVVSDFSVFIERFDEKLIQASNDGIFGGPVFALSASLQLLHINSSEMDVKTLRFLVSIIHSYRDSVDKQMKDQYCKLLSETLGIISNLKHLYASDEMEEVIFELENLFISRSPASNNELAKCKSNLALFIAGLAHMQLAETDKNFKLSAACALYHMMLRERHWALIHLALTAFGYFSARTSCDELWRFVPHDAALSYDLLSGNEANEESFMSDFKVFLDKEMALDITASNSEQLELLAKEAQVLKEMLQKMSTIKVETVDYESMEIDGESHSMADSGEKQRCKKRKVPDGISEGMELLQSGLKVIVNGLSQWQQNQPESSELQEKFKTHCSRLEDEIVRLLGLAGSK